MGAFRTGLQRRQGLGKQFGQRVTDHVAFKATEDAFSAEAEIGNQALLVCGDQAVRGRVEHALQLGLFMLQIGGLCIDPVLQLGLLAVGDKRDDDQQDARHECDATQRILNQ